MLVLDIIMAVSFSMTVFLAVVFHFDKKTHLAVFLPVVGTPFTHWIFFDLIVIFTHRLDTNIFTMKK